MTLIWCAECREHVKAPSPPVGEGWDEGSNLRQRLVPSPKPSPTGGEGSRRGIPLYTVGGLIFFITIESVLGWCALREHWDNNHAWDRIVAWNSRDTWALKNLADKQQNPCQESLSLYAQAVQDAPEQLYFREAYGQALETCRQNDYLHQAFEQYTAAYALAPHRALDALAIGRLLFIHGQIPEALTWFENCLLYTSP